MANCIVDVYCLSVVWCAAQLIVLLFFSVLCKVDPCHYCNFILVFRIAAMDKISCIIDSLQLKNMHRSTIQHYMKTNRSVSYDQSL